MSTRIESAFLLDLDGTLIDSVYQHVLSWKEALNAEGIELSVWRIHRKIGMSGGLFTNQLFARDSRGDQPGQSRTIAAEACRGLPALSRISTPAAGCAGTALIADRHTYTLGDCNQWPNGDRPP